MSKITQKWVRDEIQNGLSKALGGRSWWYKLRDPSVVVAAVAFVVYLVVEATGQFNDGATFRAETNASLKTLNQTLTEVREDIRVLRGSTIEQINALSPERFREALPALQMAVEQSPAEVEVSTAVLNQVAAKLRTTEETNADYWPTVLRFIQFASSKLAPPDIPPSDGTVDVRISSSQIAFKDTTFKNAVVLLESGAISDLRIENSRVIFTETPIRMRNVTFVNCIFEMPAVATPNQYLQRASRTLLASDLSSVQIGDL